MGLILMLVLGAGNALDQTFEEGVQAYERGDYAQSVGLFERVVRDGVVDAGVFYNLGNAYYRNGRMGPAIANYERALHLNPGMVDGRENLFRCLNETERRLSKPPPPKWEQALLFWDDSLSPPATYVLLGLCWTALWVLLGIRQYKRLPYLRRSAMVLAVLGVLLAASLWVKAHPPALAVASGPRVPVHYGMSEDETVRFELYEGDRVLVDRREKDWARVVTSDGERGWTRSHFLTFVGPPYEAPREAPYEAPREGPYEAPPGVLPEEASM